MILKLNNKETDIVMSALIRYEDYQRAEMKREVIKNPISKHNHNYHSKMVDAINSIMNRIEPDRKENL